MYLTQYSNNIVCYSGLIISNVQAVLYAEKHHYSAIPLWIVCYIMKPMCKHQAEDLQNISFRNLVLTTCTEIRNILYRKP